MLGKKLFRAFAGHSFRMRDTNSQRRESAYVQLTVLLWGNCAPQRSSVAFYMQAENFTL